MPYKNVHWEISKSIPVIMLFLAIGGQTFMFGSWAAKLDEKVEQNTLHIRDHSKDKTFHMPTVEKIELFVPRTELKSTFNNIEKKLDEINEKIDK